MSVDLQLCIDTVFETFGVVATLDPDGRRETVLMLPAQADVVSDFNGRGYIREAGTYELRVADRERCPDGLTFEIAGRRLRIESHVHRDPARLKVTLNTVPV